MNEAALFLIAVAAGGVASVTGFGIGSLLTPFLAVMFDTPLAVAMVSIPHVAGTVLRFLRLNVAPDRRVLWSFGSASAAGGLLGAFLQGSADSPWLTVIFGAVLLLTCLGELSRLTERVRFTGPFTWLAGAASGFLGGLVGNQGGIRSAALLAFNLSRETFVATATAIALVVDGARVPLYLAEQGSDLMAQVGWIAVATGGVIAGTLVGSRLLVRIPETSFRPVVAIVVGALGVWMTARGVLAF